MSFSTPLQIAALLILLCLLMAIVRVFKNNAVGRRRPVGDPTRPPGGTDENGSLLAKRAARLIREGRLPQIVPKDCWAARGSDEKCSLCDNRIGSSEVEYEVAIDVRERTIRFHLRCYQVWARQASAMSR